MTSTPMTLSRNLGSMSGTTLLFVLLLWTVLALSGNVATQIVKTPLRIVWRNRVGLKGDSRALYLWIVRLVPIFSCTIIGTVPGIWPSEVSHPWTLILSATAGMFSVIIYHGAKKAIPAAIAVLPAALRKRLGG